jgi:hypothetical protein
VPKTVIHTDDLPQWAVRKEKVPHSYLDRLTDAVHPSPDGKGLISVEEIMMRQHFDAAINNKAKAMNWLLRKIIAENAAELAAFHKRPSVSIEGVDYFQPLAPVLALLGCVTVNEPTEGSKEPATIELAAWFAEALKDRSPPEKLAPVMTWLDAGGEQKPRIRDRDRHD